MNLFKPFDGELCVAVAAGHHFGVKVVSEGEQSHTYHEPDLAMGTLNSTPTVLNGGNFHTSTLSPVHDNR